VLVAENDDKKDREEITVFSCGGDRCPKGGVHEWDGPTKKWDTGESSTCSKCGLAHIDWCMMNMP
jgi:hypothetical protein